MILPTTTEEYFAGLPRPLTPIGEWFDSFNRSQTYCTPENKRKYREAARKKAGVKTAKTTPKQSPICGCDWQWDVGGKHLCHGEHSFFGAPVIECPKLATCQRANEIIAGRE